MSVQPLEAGTKTTIPSADRVVSFDEIELQNMASPSSRGRYSCLIDTHTDNFTSTPAFLTSDTDPPITRRSYRDVLLGEPRPNAQARHMMGSPTFTFTTEIPPHHPSSVVSLNDDDTQTMRQAARRHEARSRALLRVSEEKLRVAVFRRIPERQDRKHRVFDAAADLLSSDWENLNQLHEINRGLVWEAGCLRAEIASLQHRISQLEQAHEDQARLLAFISEERRITWQHPQT